MSEIAATLFETLCSQEEVDAAIAELDKVRARWLRLPGVTAVDVGYKIVDGAPIDTLALRVHVERKRTVPKDEHIPKQQGGYPTDVIEAVYEPQGCTRPVPPGPANARERVSTLMGGVSLGGARTTAGTLGAIVWDMTDGSVCALSNWHVLAGSPASQIGEPILQPGVHDGGNFAESIGWLKRLRLDPSMDAALVELGGARGYCPTYLDPDAGLVEGVEKPRLGVKLYKTGRTTGTTWAYIDGVSLSARLRFAGGVEQLFHDQLHLNAVGSGGPVSLGGDSGSVWVDRWRRRAVGLHFAGQDASIKIPSYALANPMATVAERLKISFSPVFLRDCDCDGASDSKPRKAAVETNPNPRLRQPVPPGLSQGDFGQGGGLQGAPQPVHDPIDGCFLGWIHKGRPQPVHDPIDGRYLEWLRKGRPQPVQDPIDGRYLEWLRKGRPQPVHDPIDGRYLGVCPPGMGRSSRAEASGAGDCCTYLTCGASPRASRPQPVHDPIDGSWNPWGLRRQR